MTRINYIQFADMVKDNQDAFIMNEMKPLRDLLYILESDNTNFDETRFLKACGMGPYTEAIINALELNDERA